MPSDEIIPGRFNGPPNSGNGGYSCGLLAAHIPGPARVRLHVPPPLDTPLQVTREEDGSVQLWDGDTLVASAAAASLQLDVPSPPSEEEARIAVDGFPCYEGHSFPTCFVCGPERAQHDGLELFVGPVAGRAPLWACLWHPSQDLLDAQGNLRPEFLWAALDCPGYFAATQGTLRPAVLGEMVGEIVGALEGEQPIAVPGKAPLVVYAWLLGQEGRKYYSGTAIAAGGKVVASASATWIELRV